ncbi:MAG: DNA integrity scanning protein DisA nucleotide-binding domain protein [Phycisphaerales bacterium]|nr:DNA integrity scanning protein DisA nucleotide-binding domain protein [Phycisphaerales bacterium]
MPLLRALIDLTLPDAVDIALVSLFVYGLLLGLRRVRVRSIAALLVALALVYTIAQVAGLRLTVYLFQLSIAILGVALVIMYHGELRNAMERFLAGLGSRRRRGGGAAGEPTGWTTPLVAALHELAKRKHGALVVLSGRDDLHRHLTGGTAIGGQISEALLLSIFDPHSPGHDGAVVIDGDRIATFQAHLPLSTDFEQLHQRGTRHAAALGLAERCDALCLVVSEERGRISIATLGSLRQLDDVGDLQRTVEDFLRETRGSPARAVRFWSWPEMRPRITAVVAAYALWFVFAHEGETEYRSYVVPVEFVGLDDGLRVQKVEPRMIKVILSGPRRAFYLVGRDDVAVHVGAFDFAEGSSEYTLTASDIVRPDGLTFTNIFPRTVQVGIVGSDTTPAK